MYLQLHEHRLHLIYYLQKNYIFILLREVLECLCYGCIIYRQGLFMRSCKIVFLCFEHYMSIYTILR